MTNPQTLMASYRKAQSLNEAALRALDEGRYDALEEIFQAKAALDLSWSPENGAWTTQDLSDLGQAQSQAAQSEARLSQLLSQLGPKLTALRSAYRTENPKSTGGRLDIDQ